MIAWATQSDVMQEESSYERAVLNKRTAHWDDWLDTLRSNSESAKKNIKKVNVFPADSPYASKIAFLLYNVLTPEECQQLVGKTETLGYEALVGYSKDYRTNKRVIVSLDELSQILWDRVHDLIPEVVTNFYLPQTANSNPEEYQWKVAGMNEQFRFCRYDPGDHFSAHVDGYYKRSLDEQSLLTFMFYLNGGFGEGATNFLNEIEYRNGNKNAVTQAVVPEPGMALVFQHNILHEGQRLQSGVKYLMRTDIMYHRQVQPSAQNPMTLALQLIDLAEQHETAGRMNEAISCYQKAYKLCPELEFSTAT